LSAKEDNNNFRVRSNNNDDSPEIRKNRNKDAMENFSQRTTPLLLNNWDWKER